MDFRDLQGRLVVELKHRLQNGEITERRLAHLTGISQPHIHNVLKGARILSPDSADRILHRLHMSILDLIAAPELHWKACSCCPEHHDYRDVPVLEGLLGPGLPLPTTIDPAARFPFPRPYVAALTNPAAVRLAEDARMKAVIRHNDLVLLDHSRHSRSSFDEQGLYAVNRLGEGLVRRLRLEQQTILLGSDSSPGRSASWEEIPLEDGHILDIVRARVVWIGRYLRRL